MLLRSCRRLACMAMVALAACASAIAALAVSNSAASQAPSGCTSIKDVPPVYGGIQYGAVIQGLFDDFNGMGSGCTMCHFTPPPTPSGNLDLSDGFSWHNLVNVASNEDASLAYVVPGHPEQSLLFQKINCDSPAVGDRMPFGFPSDTLSLEQQGLVWDWIAAGAPVGITDGVFRNGFDLRGFDQ
jgi:hypothetical protein